MSHPPGTVREEPPTRPGPCGRSPRTGRRTRKGYLSIWRAMTIRWIWLVPS
jgi:hypothetical protein